MPAVLDRVDDPNDGTIKATLEPRPDKICEAVFFRTDGTAIIERGRSDGLDGVPRVCISPGAGGCPVRCPFCATGLSDSTGMFSVEEMVWQARIMREMGGVTGPVGVTFAGMNDSGLNVVNVLAASRYMIDHPEEFCSVSISTVAPTERVLPRFAAANLPIRPYVSLHADSDELRNRLVPYNRFHPLDAVILGGARYARETGLRHGRKTVASYLLLDDLDGRPVNSTPAHAHRLAAKLDPEYWQVMILLFNPDAERRLPFQRTSDDRAHEMAAAFSSHGLHAYVMPSSGRTEGINAGCGMLVGRRPTLKLVTS